MVSVASDLRLRPVGSRDVAWLVKLRNELSYCFLDPTPATVVQTARLLSGSKTYIVEQRGERIAAFAFYNVSGSEAEFGRFMIESSRHGQGLGQLIMKIALEQARLLEFRSLRLTVRADNPGAERLYLRVGFRRGSALNGTVEMRRELRE
jgi:RimJ/RimL family protein N-acetyltransferase